MGANIKIKPMLCENEQRALDVGCDLSEFLDDVPKHLVDDLVWAIITGDDRSITDNMNWIETDALNEWLSGKEDLLEEMA